VKIRAQSTASRSTARSWQRATARIASPVKSKIREVIGKRAGYTVRVRIDERIG
jgi:hypothetical protein